MTTHTQTKTYCCSYCGLERPFSQLVHNGMGFLLCPEDVECYERSQEQGESYPDRTPTQAGKEQCGAV
jgi:hypothetical protein